MGKEEAVRCRYEYPLLWAVECVWFQGSWAQETSLSSIVGHSWEVP